MDKMIVVEHLDKTFKKNCQTARPKSGIQIFI
jgi:hypothetical protein